MDLGLCFVNFPRPIRVRDIGLELREVAGHASPFGS
jgi:hypothetical protein